MAPEQSRRTTIRVILLTVDCEPQQPAFSPSGRTFPRLGQAGARSVNARSRHGRVQRSRRVHVRRRGRDHCADASPDVTGRSAVGSGIVRTACGSCPDGHHPARTVSEAPLTRNTVRRWPGPHVTCRARAGPTTTLRRVPDRPGDKPCTSAPIRRTFAGKLGPPLQSKRGPQTASMGSRHVLMARSTKRRCSWPWVLTDAARWPRPVF